MTQAANLAALGSNVNADGALNAADLTGTLPSTQLPAGSVLQVVSGTFSANASTSGTSFVDSGCTATITPKFSTSKILVQVTGMTYKSNGNVTDSPTIDVAKNGTQLFIVMDLGLYTATATENSGNFAGSYYDSPATTSALTYKVRFKNAVSAASVVIQFNNCPTVITLTEIAA